MNIPRFASAAANLLRSSLSDEGSLAGDRARGVATIERAMLARARRRRVYRSGGLLASAAALFLVIGAGNRLMTTNSKAELVSINISPAGRGAALRAGDRAEALPERGELAAGQQIETPPDGGASLQLSTGTEMDLRGSTSFRVDGQGSTERFSLQRGELSARVAKLSAGQRFIITTPDAEVEVRGTRFRVRVLSDAELCGGGSRTRLEVSEGIVEVRALGATVNVTAGRHWPSDCGPDSTDSAVAPTELPRATARPGAAVRRPIAQNSRLVTASSASAPADRGSELAQQNDLFAQGVALHRQGDVAGALHAYQALIARFPASPLAENALVERIRILASTHDPRASAEAEHYIARYPRGFALKEAQRLVASP